MLGNQHYKSSFKHCCLVDAVDGTLFDVHQPSQLLSLSNLGNIRRSPSLCFTQLPRRLSLTALLALAGRGAHAQAVIPVGTGTSASFLPYAAAPGAWHYFVYTQSIYI